MHPVRFHLIPVLAFVAACGSPEAAPGPGDVPVLALSETPTLEIGVLEGDGGLGYGFTVPPGWVPGEVLCGPPATPDTPDRS
jgi:hypothetical protein